MKNNNAQKWDDMVVKLFKDDPVALQHYIDESFRQFEQDGDTRLLLLTALKRAAQAFGNMTELASKIGYSRSYLHRALSGTVNPSLKFISSLLSVLGYRLRLEKYSQVKVLLKSGELIDVNQDTCKNIDYQDIEGVQYPDFPKIKLSVSSMEPQTNCIIKSDHHLEK